MGVLVGFVVGFSVGSRVGDLVGFLVGFSVGSLVGSLVGFLVGERVGGTFATQHCKVGAPVQYEPATDVTLQSASALQTPLPTGVVQGFEVQHLISDEPGHSPAVTVPPSQQPALRLTQTPSMPLTSQVSYTVQSKRCLFLLLFITLFLSVS